MGILVTTVAPLGQPVTLAEARTQCRLGSDTSHDTELTRLIESATEEVERQTGLLLAERTCVLYLNGFEAAEIDLLASPVQSITSIKYDDENDAEQTLATADYYSSLIGKYAYIRPVDYWPSTYYNKPNSVRVTMTAGYAPGGSPINYGTNVPEDLREAILILVYDRWNNPGDVVTGVTTATNKAFETITARHRRYR